MRPGEYPTPYVENGVATKLATCVMNGEHVDTSPSSAYWNLVLLSPSVAATEAVGVGNCGISIETNISAASAISLSDIRGLGFGSVYGSTAFAGKVRPYATHLEVNVEAPEATVCGTAYIGSAPASAVLLSTVESLAKSSTKTIDLKTTTKIDIKACINNRSLVHFRPETNLTTLGPFEDEWVSYVIFPPGTARTLEGATMPFNIRVVAHSNVVWWPAVSNPALNAIVAKQPASTAPETLSQNAFIKQAETFLASPVPFTNVKVSQVVNALIRGAEMIPGIGSYVSAARGLAQMSMQSINDPRSMLSDYSNIVIDLQWMMMSLSAKYSFSDPIAEANLSAVLDAIEAGVEAFEAMQQARANLLAKYKSCTRHVRVRGHEATIEYLDSDGVLYDHRDSVADSKETRLLHNASEKKSHSADLSSANSFRKAR